MTPKRTILADEPRNGIALGWMLAPGEKVAHYFRSRDGKSYAVSRCGITCEKRDLHPKETGARCTNCYVLLDVYTGKEEPKE